MSSQTRLVLCIFICIFELTSKFRTVTPSSQSNVFLALKRSRATKSNGRYVITCPTSCTSIFVSFKVLIKIFLFQELEAHIGSKTSTLGRTVTLQMLLDAKILLPAEGAMTIEYLVNILHNLYLRYKNST